MRRLMCCYRRIKLTSRPPMQSGRNFSSPTDISPSECTSPMLDAHSEAGAVLLRIFRARGTRAAGLPRLPSIPVGHELHASSKPTQARVNALGVNELTLMFFVTPVCFVEEIGADGYPRRCSRVSLPAAPRIAFRRVLHMFTAPLWALDDPRCATLLPHTRTHNA